MKLCGGDPKSVPKDAPQEKKDAATKTRNEVNEILASTLLLSVRKFNGDGKVVPLEEADRKAFKQQEKPQGTEGIGYAHSMFHKIPFFGSILVPVPTLTELNAYEKKNPGAKRYWGIICFKILRGIILAFSSHSISTIQQKNWKLRHWILLEPVIWNLLFGIPVFDFSVFDFSDIPVFQ